jgi:GTP cyclohydrolase I
VRRVLRRALPSCKLYAVTGAPVIVNDRIPMLVATLLRELGEDPHRDGLVDTPDRVARAWREMTEGYRQDAAAILDATFDVGPYDQMVVVRDIEFWSLCEHHLLPFHGMATVGYLPGDRVVGLSKIGRLVNCFARRLQVQERLTQQIADAMNEHLKPKGVGVLINATHTCMAMRGVRLGADMVTSALLGRFRDDAVLRSEFLALAGR